MDMTLNDNAFRFGKNICLSDVALKTTVMHLTVFLLCMMAFDRYIKIGYNSFIIKSSKKKYMAITAFLWARVCGSYQSLNPKKHGGSFAAHAHLF